VGKRMSRKLTLIPGSLQEEDDAEIYPGDMENDFSEWLDFENTYEDRCKCESWTLLHFGCKCGFVERQKRRKELEEEIDRIEKERKKKHPSDDIPF
jgi:hypothetical protein